jgi:hypothetical protein
VQRLYQLSCKFSKEYVDDRKVEFGVSIKAFREFFVKDDLAYSLVEVCQFAESDEGGKPYEFLKKFVEQNLFKSDNFEQILVLGVFQNGQEIVSHAGTFLRQMESGRPRIKYFDPNRSGFLGSGELCMQGLDYKDAFRQWQIITVFAL